MNTATFRTIVEPAFAPANTLPNDSYFLIGSCFASNIGEKLKSSLLPCMANPFGAAYNPKSIEAQLKRIVHNIPFSANESVAYGNRFYSFQAHSDISASSVEELQNLIDQATCEAHEALRAACVVCLTLGTAWVFEHKELGSVVANCHKLPASNFVHRKLSVVEAASSLDTTISTIRSFNPNAVIVLTVSPIRHLRNGAHANQLSKATLLLATNEMSQNAGVEYFPSYEMLLDDLRDYRFYADDMAHPSAAATEYIFQAFAEAFFSSDTKLFCAEAQKISAALAHRPFCRQSIEYQQFLQKTIERTEALKNKFGVQESNAEFSRALRELKNRYAESQKA